MYYVVTDEKRISRRCGKSYIVIISEIGNLDNGEISIVWYCEVFVRCEVENANCVVAESKQNDLCQEISSYNVF